VFVTHGISPSEFTQRIQGNAIEFFGSGMVGRYWKERGAESTFPKGKYTPSPSCRLNQSRVEAIALRKPQPAAIRIHGVGMLRKTFLFLFWSQKRKVKYQSAA
jgi:hypothetical protein